MGTVGSVRDLARQAYADYSMARQTYLEILGTDPDAPVLFDVMCEALEWLRIYTTALID